MLPRKLKGIEAATASAWAGTLPIPALSTNSVSSNRFTPERDQAHRDEAHRLRVGSLVTRVEGPMAIQDEVVQYGNQPGGHRGGVVIDADRVHEQGIDRQVDHESGRSDGAEANQLKPVGGTAHAMEHSHVGPQLHSRGILVHRSRVAALPGRRPR